MSRVQISLTLSNHLSFPSLEQVSTYVQVPLCDLCRRTCIFEGNHDDQRCIPEHSRTACRVLYTHMSSTAFLDHCLWIIIKRITNMSTSCWWLLTGSLTAITLVKETSCDFIIRFLLSQEPHKQGSVWAQCSLSIFFYITIGLIWSHTARKCAYPLLTLPDCEHQKKHKENQAQSPHVWVPITFQTLLWTGWCCIYTAFQPRGRSPSCSVQITITKYRWMMAVWGLKVRTISLLSSVDGRSFLRIWDYFSGILTKRNTIILCTQCPKIKLYSSNSLQ